jgi:hypothetical protein
MSSHDPSRHRPFTRHRLRSVVGQQRPSACCDWRQTEGQSVDHLLQGGSDTRCCCRAQKVRTWKSLRVGRLPRSPSTPRRLIHHGDAVIMMPGQPDGWPGRRRRRVPWPTGVRTVTSAGCPSACQRHDSKRASIQLDAYLGHAQSSNSAHIRLLALSNSWFARRRLGSRLWICSAMLATLERSNSCAPTPTITPLAETPSDPSG